MLEVTLVYEKKRVTMAKPENKYGSNLADFSTLLKLALESVELQLDGEIKEANAE